MNVKLLVGSWLYVAVATFASAAPCSGQEPDRDRVALAGDDPIQIAEAARRAAESGRRDLVDDLIAALERIPVRDNASDSDSQASSATPDSERESVSYLPCVILDALVELQAKPSPGLLSSWWGRKKQYDFLRGPLRVLVARDPSANAELLAEALLHWEDDLFLGAIAADHFRRTDPRRLVGALIDRRFVEIRIRVVDTGRRTLIGSGFACYKSRWPKKFPRQVAYDFSFEAKERFEPLLSGGVPLFWRHEVTERTWWCDSLEGDHAPRAGEITSWRDAALANLRAVAGLDVAAGLPRADQFLVHDWTDDASLREFVGAQRRRTGSEWSALLARLVEAKALDAAEMARHDVRIRVEITDARTNPAAGLPKFDSE